MKQSVQGLSIAMLLALATFQAPASGIDPGKAKVAAACQTCHGMDGQGVLAGMPNLSGQNREYMVAQLEAFRSGRRHHEQMSIIAQMLSDEDIENTADWYASIIIRVEPPK